LEATITHHNPKNPIEEGGGVDVGVCEVDTALLLLLLWYNGIA